MVGKIQRVVEDKGFGFIKSANKEYFFHRSALLDTDWEEICYRVQALGRDKVEVNFEPEKSDKGPRANNVKLVEDGD